MKVTRLSFVLALLCAMLLPVPPFHRVEAWPADGPTSQQRTIVVNGSTAWSTTDIDLTAGSLVEISARGTIKVASWDSGQSPAGDSSCPYGRNGLIAPDLPCWSLIGRIGLGGEPFYIGTGSSFRASSSGPLYLGVNDDVFSDNTGSWTVTVTIAPSQRRSNTVVINSTIAWSTTDVDLTAGSQVEISARGTIKVASWDSGQSPAGDPSCPYGRNGLVAPDLPCWSLIGRIGLGGEPFFIGTGTSFRASSSGPLYLGVNDDVFNDNTGSWTVNITVTP